MHDGCDMGNEVMATEKLVFAHLVSYSSYLYVHWLCTEEN